MRAALLIVLGLAIGILGTVFTMNALHERENPMPDAVMSIMGFHMHALSTQVKSQHCDAAAAQAQLARLDSTAQDIDVAFTDVPAGFRDAAAKLQQATKAAVAAAPTECAALAAVIKPVHEACESCHRQYR